MNKAIIIGNVGKAELTDKCFKFSVATTDKWKDKEGNQKESTEWHNVTVFGNYGKTLSSFVNKGTKVAVEGKISTTSYEKEGQKRYSTSIIASSVEAFSSPTANSEDVPF